MMEHKVEEPKMLVQHNYKVGDEVSYGFNGDWYPCGKVARITKKFLTTDTGHKFSLRQISDRCKIVQEDGFTDWVDCVREVFQSVNGGTWTLCHGVINEWNPHF